MKRDPSSFRDPDGFVYRRDGIVHRQIHASYAEDYDQLVASGLLESLIGDGLLIPHEEVGLDQAATGEAVRVLRPEPVGFISYPYEWCFSQLKDAALLTLQIQEQALDRGMCLKDASAFNVQFHQGRPIFIDTLSFARRIPGTGWAAYHQFCRHFLAPLALMVHHDAGLAGLLRVHLDGVSLPLASSLLPARTWLNFSKLVHLHLHARSVVNFSDDSAPPSVADAAVSPGSNPDKSPAPGSRPATGRRLGGMSDAAIHGLVDSLRGAVGGLVLPRRGTVWRDYYQNTNYKPESMSSKESLVEAFIGATDAKIVWDLGANTGRFSRIASRRGLQSVALEADPEAVEACYLELRSAKETRVLPLVMDLMNPSPNQGWAGEERASLEARGPTDLILALALIHHLCIGNNVPFDHLARFLGRLTRWLILEFVPHGDSQVDRMLRIRNLTFDHYNRENFEAAFMAEFECRRSDPIPGTKRTLYLFERRTPAVGES